TRLLLPHTLHDEHHPSGAETPDLRCPSKRIKPTTVHGVKGMEFPGVVLVLPDRLRVDPVTGRTVLDDWEGAHNTEARRVLYVAGSRAQELLVCALHRKHTSRVAAILDVKGVPYSTT
ncbi:3'-5' exonuclease, partial [Streptomyces griseofuscus]